MVIVDDGKSSGGKKSGRGGGMTLKARTEDGGETGRDGTSSKLYY
jgi:hypothetical protein